MKRKTRSTIAVISALCIAFGAMAGCGKKSNDADLTTTAPISEKAEESNTSSVSEASSDSSSTKAPENKSTTKNGENKNTSYKIKYSGFVHNGDIYTHNNTDYCISGGKIYAVTGSKKTELSTNKKISHFNIINDKIYYTVIDEDHDTGTWESSYVKCSCWRMDLDGKNPTQLTKSLSPSHGTYDIIYATEDTLYLSGMPTNEELGYGDNFYKYDIKSAKMSNVTKKDDNLQSFTYVDGYIVYTDAHTDPKSMAVYSYDIKKDTVKALDLYANDIVKFNDNTVVLSRSAGINAPSDSKEYLKGPGLLEYTPSTGKTKTIVEYDRDNMDYNTGFHIFGSNIMEEVYFAPYKDAQGISKYSSADGLKENLIKMESEVLSNGSDIIFYDFCPDDNGYYISYSTEVEGERTCYLSYYPTNGQAKQLYKSDDFIVSIGKNIILVDTGRDEYKIVDIPKK